MTQTPDRVLLCGDPQQPSRVMRESLAALEQYDVEFDLLDWRDDLSAAEFRDVTMDMEARGPADYDAPELHKRVTNARFLVVHKAPVSRRVFERADSLEAVAAARGGTENIDREAAADQGTTVFHAPGRNANAVADYAVSFALAAHRGIPHFVETTARGSWELEFDPEGLPQDVSSLTVGVVGFGHIGRKVADRWAGFGPDLLVTDPYVDDQTIADAGITPADLDDTLSRSDIVTLHVRLSEETHHMFAAPEFERMRDDALLVNTARGGLVETDALVEALEDGTIGGAVLDVFEEEPLPEGHRLLGLDNTWLSPHTAGSTRDAVYNGGRIVASDIAAIIEGREPEHRVE